ncbi:response regulator [Paragemmobacter ruber]|uniref:Response regulator n=1 Tax=Paragemmobacter ruber TaxID=1985673 RepID=A0ABW9Y1L0_9RHOB|nr:response regulator [Rhodobacter ruber]NBE06119.1 response regulator [Rhodobacter ruber]
MTVLNRILHVEDDEDILMIARLALADLGGFEVLQCSSGAQAVVQAAAFAPDLLLLDYMMPEMNGLQTLQALREQPELAQTPAIFMTAKAMDTVEAEFGGLGVLGRITKPFDPVSLPADIRRIWKSRKDGSAG